MLNKLKALNPTLALYDVTDPAFDRYGRIVVEGEGGVESLQLV